MGRSIILLLISIFTLSVMESQAKSIKKHFQDTASSETLTPKELRQIKKDQQRQAKELADDAAFEAAKTALQDSNWVLMANTVYGRRGASIPVSDNANFIQFKGDIVYIQLAFDGIAGTSGVGSITIQGIPSKMRTDTEKKGSVTYSFHVGDITLNAQIVIELTSSSNYASASVHPMNGNILRFSGILVPTSQSGIFRNGFTNY